jgi:hypothetical protein
MGVHRIPYNHWCSSPIWSYASPMSASHPSAEILAWAKKQTAWRQDALRRVLTKAFTKTDEDECLELLKAEYGVAQTKLKFDPLDPKHLPVRSTSATNLRLVALNDIANVNRLAKDAALTLASNGLTLIYGDNGSGNLRTRLRALLDRADCRTRGGTSHLRCRST